MPISGKQKFFIHLCLIVGIAVVIVPFLWMVSTSLKTFTESMQVPPVWFPAVLQWGNYIDVTETINFAKAYINTTLVVVGRTLGQLILCSMAAYAFARLDFPFKNVLFLLTLSVLMVPIQIIMIPSYGLMRMLNWLDTFYVLIVPGFFSAFGTFLLRQFFMTIPKELEDAAKIDGCSYFGIYWRIFLPLSGPGLVALTIFTVQASWNDLLWPLIMTSSNNMRVLSVAMATLQGQHVTNFPLLMAGATMATLPLIIMFIFLQRYFIQGISMTGIK
ncbi:carbohydrate ABC transporter permease [Alkalihalobacillus sp. 1P02AB]|uniref:carbohydrate ABC transporter permease n=1 Tax=Alkalihalobacillus sp. 1P02AB TaxID=3132260 RepID=UPI0039A64B15